MNRYEFNLLLGTIVGGFVGGLVGAAILSGNDSAGAIVAAVAIFFGGCLVGQRAMIQAQR